MAFVPVEHFRPKTEADRSPGSGETEGYWWLCWTWENLLFSCVTCNGKKGTRFPLGTSQVLAPESSPPGPESALLLDPATDDPSEHLHFVEVSGQWCLVANEGSDKGAHTLEVLRFSMRQDLRTIHNAHVSKMVLPLVASISDAIAREDSAAVIYAWNHAVNFLLAPTQPFIALSRAALIYYVAEDSRNRWGLFLPPPPKAP